MAASAPSGRGGTNPAAGAAAAAGGGASVRPADIAPQLDPAPKAGPPPLRLKGLAAAAAAAGAGPGAGAGAGVGASDEAAGAAGTQVSTARRPTAGSSVGDSVRPAWRTEMGLVGLISPVCRTAASTSAMLASEESVRLIVTGPPARGMRIETDGIARNSSAKVGRHSASERVPHKTLAFVAVARRGRRSASSPWRPDGRRAAGGVAAHRTQALNSPTRGQA